MIKRFWDLNSILIIVNGVITYATVAPQRRKRQPPIQPAPTIATSSTKWIKLNWIIYYFFRKTAAAAAVVIDVVRAAGSERRLQMGQRSGSFIVEEPVVAYLEQLVVMATTATSPAFSSLSPPCSIGLRFVQLFSHFKPLMVAIINSIEKNSIQKWIINRYQLGRKAQLKRKRNAKWKRFDQIDRN